MTTNPREQQHRAATSSMSVRRPKKLIVCCDGTWADSDNSWVKGKRGQPGHPAFPTNVARIARAIKPEDDDHHPQITYYQAGIGTGLGVYNHVVGGGTGLGLAVHVREAYAFLASNYSEHESVIPPDSIFLIGFSRGAYTARSLGGFICAMGILKRQAMAHFYEIFEDWVKAGDPKHEPVFFKNYFQHHTDVKEIHPDYRLSKSRKTEERDKYLKDYFSKLEALGLTQKAYINAIGVWDTVGALGIPVNPILQKAFPFLPSFFRSYKWYDTRLDDQMRNAFQALALDERRFPFSPAIWENNPDHPTNLQQVWFPGSHSDVGGSYPDSGIANMTLAWMMDRLSGNMVEDRSKFHHRDWIQFDEDRIGLWYDCQLAGYQTHKRDKYRPWALGKISDSNTFPHYLLGKRTRQPGRNFASFYGSGRVNRERPLVHTSEQIHRSVRRRIEKCGRGVEPQWDGVIGLGGWHVTPLIQYAWRHIRKGEISYDPRRKGHSLHGWSMPVSLEEPDDITDGETVRVKWVWQGQEGYQPLPEAKLGRYEMKFFQQCNKNEMERKNIFESASSPSGRVNSLHGRTF
ncbi:hypothetical protein K470DRAFT_274897 [Piedraia hortae CBS 480.64]|uniref:T6SS Phospholipase effector Tle1-like catalytic domain-containing protein n=1 Tax=Piedraia hortae CBS 480.64 TaxID=1314780 RepID=A0A6A7C6N9_9PEZI|nr:hypothetical protein K470DRAFT_274897 [Piedraia hortae CBS 480.64]